MKLYTRDMQWNTERIYIYIVTQGIIQKLKYLTGLMRIFLGSFLRESIHSLFPHLLSLSCGEHWTYLTLSFCTCGNVYLGTYSCTCSTFFSFFPLLSQGCQLRFLLSRNRVPQICSTAHEVRTGERLFVRWDLLLWLSQGCLWVRQILCFGLIVR